MNDISFQIFPLDSVTSLESDWVEVEQKSNNHIFLSWQWISTWLSVYQPSCRVLKCLSEGKLVAIALLTELEQRSGILLNSRCVRLHQTGISTEDQIWIEYNGVLVCRGYEQEVNRSWMEYTVSALPHADEFVLSGISESHALEIQKTTGLLSQEVWAAPCYGVDLQALRDKQLTYLDSLSRNTRHQLRRSLRLLNSSSEASVCRADTAQRAKEFFASAGQLHQQRWGSGVGESGFANSEFMKFHESLIGKGVEAGWVDVIKVAFENGLDCYFYNLIYQGRVYFYLGSTVTSASSKIKTGLSGHALCIQYYLDRGLDFYDFMSGSERYKASLAAEYDGLVGMRFMRNKARYRLELQLRRIKRYLLKSRMLD